MKHAFTKLVLAAGLFAVSIYAGPIAAQADTVYKAKFSSEVHDDHPKVIAFRKFADLVKERTNDEVQVTVFPANQLGGEMEAAEGIKLGSVQMGALTTSVLTPWVPELQVIDLPFIFRNDEHVFAASEYLVDRLSPNFEAQGFKLLGFTLNGARQPMSTFPIKTPEDIKGKKMRVIQSPLHVSLWKSVGANPVPIPAPEIYTSLQTGVVDFFDNTPTNYLTYKFHEVAPFYTDLSHIYALGAWIVDKQWFDKLPEAHQKVVMDTAVEILPELHTSLKAMDKAALDETVKRGATVIPVEDKAPWQKLMLPIWDDYGKKIPGGEEMIKDIGAL